MTTKDLGLIAALYTLNIDPEEIFMEGTVVLFRFPDTATVEGICHEYFDGTLMVKAFQFKNAIKQVRKTMFSHMKTQ